ncbi:MAG: BamA/TamA family outer membrane protein [Bacteroidales bacterium]|nr:BamA/TamA family outer membrane protein [Bacteroidales bacterium]MDD4703247.1 BamA/TamA family outer membrane protein [Bacteroidales bacterium]
MGIKKLLNLLFLFFLTVIIITGCSPYKHISKDGYLLSRNKVLISEKNLPKSDFVNLIKQDPNSSFIGVKWGMYFYSNSPAGEDSTVSFFSRNVFRRLGQKPVEFSKDLTYSSAKEMKEYLRVKGCFDGKVVDSVVYKKRKAKVFYHVNIGKRYKVDTFFVSSEDNSILPSVLEIMSNSPIKKGVYYDETMFADERDRLALELKKQGFFDFSAEYILFNIDTSNNNYTTKVNLFISSKRKSANLEDDSSTVVQNNTFSSFKKFKIRNIYIYPDYSTELLNTDLSKLDTSIIFHRQKDKFGLNKYVFIAPLPQKMKIKPILRSVMFQRDSFFSPIYAERTYNALNQLRNFKFIDISYIPFIFDNKATELDTSLLDCVIRLSLEKPVQISTSLEANFSAVNNSLLETNSSNLGMEFNVGVFHKNIFKSAEIFSSNAKATFEMRSDIFNRNADTISRWSLVNALEAGIDFGIEFPRFLIPFGTKFYSMQFLPHTTIKAGYNFQKRAYFERSIFNLNYGYSWNYTTKYSHAIIPIDINFVKINITSQDYVDFIATLDRRIRYQYSDHLVTATRYSFIYNSQKLNKKEDFHYLRFNIESAGNLIYLINNLSASPQNELKQYTIFGIPYNQYLRTDFDFKRYIYLNEKQSLVYRVYGGIGVPYGNSKGLPYEKSFFSGGNNNHRAWELRELGPGSSKMDETQLRYDRSGDIQIGGNIEYRFPIYSIVEGATFMDVGNVWTLYEQKDMDGGQFQFDRFYNELAVGAGLGLRLNLQFFIVRFDFAIKVWDPAEDLKNRLVIPNTKFRGINLNFGIGYPF